MTTEVKAAATKSLGEKLFDAVIFASDQSHDWSALPSDIQIRFEQSATIFAAEALSQATEENERLTEERDAANDTIQAMERELTAADEPEDYDPSPVERARHAWMAYGHNATALASWQERATKVEAEKDEALEALKPFAAKLVDIGQDEADDDHFSNARSPYNQAVSVKVGDLRRAAALLAQSAQKEGA